MSDAVNVGAGAAGLTAAYILQQANFTVTVLEASSVFGCRVKKDSRLGQDLDVGANFIPINADPTPNELFGGIFESDFNVDSFPEQLDVKYWISGLEYLMNNTNPLIYHRWTTSTWWDFLNDESVIKARQ